MKKVLCFLLLVSVVWNIVPGYAYRCYECIDIKGTSQHCESNVKDVLQPNCTEGFVCIKYILRTGNITTITRGCSPRTKCEELHADPINTVEFCETCESSLCNAAYSPNYLFNLWVPLSFVMSFICFKLYQL